MTIALPPVRLHTLNSPYHYTEDNKPLEDLSLRDEVLKEAIETAAENNLTGIAVGNWTGLQVSLDLSAYHDSPFAFRVRIWAIEDQSTAASQNATLSEDILMGFVAVNDTINILSTFNNYKRQQGINTLTYSFAPSGSFLNITFSGYAGNNGYVVVRVERFGP